MNLRPWDLGKLEVYADVLPWSGGISLHGRYHFQENGNIRRSYISSMVLTQMEPKHEGMRLDPFWEMTHQEAQALVDELWRAGIRPSEGTGSAGSLAATERHLKDLQRLVFKDKKP